MISEPMRAQAFTLPIQLQDQANMMDFKANPTLAAGDIVCSGDGGAESNVAFSISPAAGTHVQLAFTAAQMDFDCVSWKARDVAGAEWAGVSGRLFPSGIGGALDAGTAQVSAAGTFVLRSGALFGTDYLPGSWVTIYGGTCAGQSRFTTGNVSGTDTLTVDPVWNGGPPDTTSKYVLWPGPPSPTGAGLPNVNVQTITAGAINAAALATAAVTKIIDAIGAAVASSYVVAGSWGLALSKALSLTFTGTDVNAKANVIAADAVDANALKADAVTEMQNGLATATNLATLAGYVDTEVAAIKAKTDQLNFTSTKVDAHVVTVATDAIGSGAIATSAITEIRDGILNWIVFTGFNLAKLFRVFFTVVRGTADGRETLTETITSPADGVEVVVTYDADRNKLTVTDNASSTP